MSIIMRNICGGGSGSSSKGFPPGDVTNINIMSRLRSCALKWEEPEAVSSYNGITLSTWYSTIIVRNDDHYPTSIKDGIIILTNTERNKYKDEYFIDDNNIVNGNTYYYRFYTLSTDKIYNDSNNMIYKITVTVFDPVLKNNSWKSINEAAESGAASSIWNIGDEIEIQTSEYYDSINGNRDTISAQTITLQIWDFNHFDKSDGTGKAGICFGMKNLLIDTKKNNDNSSIHSWDEAYLKTTIVPIFISVLPEDLKQVIKNVITYAAGYDKKYNKLEVQSNNTVFIPGFTEVFGNNYSSDNSYIECNKYETNQIKFPIFTNDNSRIKQRLNGTNYQNWSWWLRSRYYHPNEFYGYLTYMTGTNGSAGYSRDYPSYTEGVCFCFNV